VDESIFCSNCGEENRAGAKYCSNCGQRLLPAVSHQDPGSDERGIAGAAWEPPTDVEEVTQPSIDDPLPEPTMVRYASVGDAIIGQARIVQVRTEQKNPYELLKVGDRSESILTFRVERFDEDGNRLPFVPVEMRASRFEGSMVSEGDWVEVSGRWSGGQTVRPKRLRNLTTGDTLEAKEFTQPFFLWILLIIVVVFILSVAWWIISSFITFLSTSGY
jgi:hypothetical protein